MRQVLGDWLLRVLALVGLTILITLWVLVRPLPEPPFPTIAPSKVGELTPTSQFTVTPSCTATPTPAAIPTITPLFTPKPTVTPALPPTSIFTPTLTVTPASAHVPTSTSVPSSSASLEADAVEGPGGGQLAGQVEQHVYPSQVTGNEESCRIYLPPGYDRADRRYPVLYLLHGWPYDEAHWGDLGADEAADAGIVSGTLPAFIIVMPGADPDGLYVETSGGDRSFEGQVVNDLIPHVDAAYRTRAERQGRAIGGISRGGVWALEIGFRNAGLFSAVGAHSPALSANLAPPVYDPFNLLEEPGVAALRVYLSAGDVDWTWKSTKALHEALDEQGIANEFVVHSGGHRNALWAENVAEYLAFYAAGW